jgi:hypothetical protein
MSSASLRARVRKGPGREAISILQRASAKTSASIYEVEYTIEKVCRFPHFKAGGLLCQHGSSLAC